MKPKQVERRNRKTKQQIEFEFLVESTFHRAQLNRVRKALGSKCTYLSHEQRTFKKGVEGRGPFYFIKAVMINETGGKDTVTYEIEGSPKTFTEQDYNTLFKKLNVMSYVGESSEAGV